MLHILYEVTEHTTNHHIKAIFSAILSNKGFSTLSKMNKKVQQYWDKKWERVNILPCIPVSSPFTLTMCAIIVGVRIQVTAVWRKVWCVTRWHVTRVTRRVTWHYCRRLVMTLFLGGVDFMNNVDCLFLSKHLHTNTEIYSGLYKDSNILLIIFWQTGQHSPKSQTEVLLNIYF